VGGATSKTEAAIAARGGNDLRSPQEHTETWEKDSAHTGSNTCLGKWAPMKRAKAWEQDSLPRIRCASLGKRSEEGLTPTCASFSEKQAAGEHDAQPKGLGDVRRRGEKDCKWRGVNPKDSDLRNEKRERVGEKRETVLGNSANTISKMGTRKSSFDLSRRARGK